MSKLGVTAIFLLLVSITLAGAQSRKTLGTVDTDTIQAMEHQRILAELEEVHQLRERMLQEGMHTSAECRAHKALISCIHAL